MRWVSYIDINSSFQFCQSSVCLYWWYASCELLIVIKWWYIEVMFMEGLFPFISVWTMFCSKPAHDFVDEFGERYCDWSYCHMFFLSYLVPFFCWNFLKYFLGDFFFFLASILATKTLTLNNQCYVIHYIVAYHIFYLTLLNGSLVWSCGAYCILIFLSMMSSIFCISNSYGL